MSATRRSSHGGRSRCCARSTGARWQMRICARRAKLPWTSTPRLAMPTCSTGTSWSGTESRTRRRRRTMTCTRSKMRLLRPSAALLLALLLGAAAPARADEKVDAALAYMRKTVDDVLAILDDKSLHGKARIDKLET